MQTHLAQFFVTQTHLSRQPTRLAPGARPNQDMTALRPRGLELVILEQQPGEAASQGGPFGLGNFGAGPFLLGKCWAGEVRHGTPGGGCAQSPLARLAVRPRLCRSCHVRLGPWPISPYRRRCRAAAVTKGRVRPGRRFWWGWFPSTPPSARAGEGSPGAHPRRNAPLRRGTFFAPPVPCLYLKPETLAACLT